MPRRTAVEVEDRRARRRKKIRKKVVKVKRPTEHWTLGTAVAAAAALVGIDSGQEIPKEAVTGVLGALGIIPYLFSRAVDWLRDRKTHELEMKELAEERLEMEEQRLQLEKRTFRLEKRQALALEEIVGIEHAAEDADEEEDPAEEEEEEEEEDAAVEAEAEDGAAPKKTLEDDARIAELVGKAVTDALVEIRRRRRAARKTPGVKTTATRPAKKTTKRTGRGNGTRVGSGTGRAARNSPPDPD